MAQIVHPPLNWPWAAPWVVLISVQRRYPIAWATRRGRRPTNAWLAGLLLVLAGIGLVFSTGCNASSKQHNAAGVALYQQGMYPAAAQRFQQAIYNDPTGSNGYYNLAATLHRQGIQNRQSSDLDQAESYYNQCLDHSPNHRECYRGLTVLLCEQGRTAEAYRLLEGWSVRSPTLADPKIELARLNQEFGNKTAARDKLLEALSVEPNNPRALAALGRFHEESGNPTQALADYQRSLYFNRSQPEVAARVAKLSPTYGSVVGTPTTYAPSRTVNVQQPIFR